ncbi:MAG: PQQ-dependent sugar dehydrogenase [Verrucomicrobiota bacterium]
MPTLSAQTLTPSDDEPTSNIYLSETGENGEGYRISRKTDTPVRANDSRAWGWTFQTGEATTIGQLVLRYEVDRSRPAAANRSNLVLALIQDSAPSSPSDGLVVFQLEFDATMAIAAGQYLYFNLGSTYALDANSFYHFEIWFADPNGGQANEFFFAREENFGEIIGDGIELYQRRGDINLDNNTFPIGAELSPNGNASDARNPVFYLIENTDINITVGVGGSFAFSAAPLSEAAPTDFTIGAAAQGTTSVSANGRQVLYQHTGQGTGTDTFDFQYTLDDEDLFRTVNVTISDAARLPNTTSTVPLNAPTNEIGLVPAFGDLSFLLPVEVTSAPGDTQRLWVVGKLGAIDVIPDVTAEDPTRISFLDIASKVSGRGEDFPADGELGLLGLAFHPDYLTNGYFFTVYNVAIDGTFYQILSRWTDPNPGDDDGENATEEILIRQLNEARNHNGGDIAFGPDGYLYMSWGDEGRANDFYRNSQFLDKDFWSLVTRIDVDLEAEDYTASDGQGNDDSNLAPNSHPAIVLHSGNPLYEIPADNPWIGATIFNGVSINPSNVRTEAFAVGFRNPWRMDFDSMTGDLWVGDVGQNAREEVSIVTLGSNHGWGWREGKIAADTALAGELINGAAESAATLTDPEWDYTHGSSTFQGQSVTGGVVYYGNLAELNGKYIFGDYVSGNIWSLERTGTPGSPIVERIAGDAGVVDFGRDPSNGDVLVVDIGDGIIKRLVTISSVGQFPSTLSETGLFADVTSLSPNPGVVAYGVNLPFWSDQAIKSRWFTIPDTVNQFGYDAERTWNIPTGTIFIKHFDMLADNADPNSAFKLETRLIVKDTSGVYGVTYQWNEAQTDAVLVPDEGEDITFMTTEGGILTSRNWRFPSRSECLTCHSANAGGGLSFNTRQLNRGHPNLTDTQNFIQLMRDTGYLDRLPTPPEELPRHIRPEEGAYSLEARVRSYLAVNCAYCHQPGGGTGSSWDVRSQQTLVETGIIRGLLSRPVGSDDRLIVPNNTTHSAILSRMSETNGYTRMPPLATYQLDQTNINLVNDWINNELQNNVTYDEWRLANFGSASSPEGAATADPDGDGNDNNMEWVINTNPNLPDSLNFSLYSGAGSFGMEFEGLGNRQVVIEHSTDLINWTRWDVPGNDGLPRNPDFIHRFTSPMADPQSFLRLNVSEN